MADKSGRVNYYRPDEAGEPELVDVRQVVLDYCRRKERERRRDGPDW
jgi:hypothetical protein